MRAAKLSAGLLAAGGILGYLGADWQSRSLLIAAGVVLLTGVIVAAFTELGYR
ncbi:hypothetical protein [Yersinia aldovae]|uniref:Membrane protein n=1 Tax=Yersinia aldovae TaxID=29483 RepID=A0A0T9U9T5_YERAL|nr:hypothetical protein [Yersinia aldovae]CNJ96257.1 Membrane protein [Yersinia aldovae]CNL10529.1 Membrane protein [Yersinia aldovae]CNL28447.1 Membrane protein [Yersinia aldovae]